MISLPLSVSLPVGIRKINFLIYPYFMWPFSRKDSCKTRTHKVVTGLIIGGAVGSVLSIYATRKDRDCPNGTLFENEEDNSAIDPAEELSHVDSAETVVAKRAVKPVRRFLKKILKAVWISFKAVFHILERLGRR